MRFRSSVLSLLLALFSAASAFGLSPTTSVIVPGTSAGTRSGLYLISGDQVRLTATGQINTLPPGSGNLATPAGNGFLKIVSAEFGLLDPAESDSQNPKFRSATKVPFKPGQDYGWIIQLDTTKDKIKWREEFTLPAAPETWASEETEGEQVVSSDRKTSVTQREVQPENGLIFNFWEVAAGDPKGHYTIRVFVEDELVSTFEFDVE